jgi:SPP1 family predicted phage head-tail adaptor
MAKEARAGQMKTQITVKALTPGTDGQGYPTETWTDIFDGRIWCMWVNAHGTEVYDAMRLDLNEPATITTRYTDKINVRCRIWREPDPLKQTAANAYEVISVDDVGDEHKFLEIKVKRLVVA